MCTIWWQKWSGKKSCRRFRVLFSVEESPPRRTRGRLLNSCQVLPRWWFSAKPCAFWCSRLGREGRDWRLSRTMFHDQATVPIVRRGCVYTQAAPIFGHCESCQAPLLPILLRQLISLQLFCFLLFSLFTRWSFHWLDWLVHIANHLGPQLPAGFSTPLCFSGETATSFPLTPHLLIIYFPTRFSVKNLGVKAHYLA